MFSLGTVKFDGDSFESIKKFTGSLTGSDLNIHRFDQPTVDLSFKDAPIIVKKDDATVNNNLAQLLDFKESHA